MDWYRNRNIRVKINLIYIILIAGQTLVLTAFAVMIFSTASVNNTINRMQGNSRLVINNIQNIMNNAESYANDLTVRLNNYFVTGKSVDLNDEYAAYDQSTALKKIFRNVLYVYPQLYGVVFITPDGRYITSDNMRSDGSYSEITDAYTNMKELDEGSGWLRMARYDFTDGKAFVLPLCKRIVNINTGDYIGFLSIMINETTFSDVYTNFANDDSTKYFFCDKNGVLVSSDNKSMILKTVSDQSLKNWIIKNDEASHIMTIGGTRVLVTKSQFTKTGWELIGIVPMDKIEADSRKIGGIVVLLGIICMLISGLLSNVLSSSITRPLRMLIYDVQNLKLDNLDEATQVESGDDVGLLAKSFNSMKSRINELLVNNMMQKEKQRKSELKLLQAQIQPHFLYNSLQMIYAMIDMSDQEKAQKSVKSLADFYRTALSKGNDIITIGEELSNTADYLYIQKIRYADTFNYAIECDPELKRYKIPKLTLQPIVENSVCHGFAGRKIENGSIGIKVTREGDTIIIMVHDNGVGMSQEKISDTFSDKISGSRESFGLKNIDERIKLYYGYSYGLKISSELARGTSVFVYIPTIENLFE